MSLLALSFLPLAIAQTLIYPGINPYRVGEGNTTAKATREGWDAAFSTINATGSAVIPGKDIRLPFPGNTSSDWKYTISVRDDVPHAAGQGFFTATWLQLEAPQELLSKAMINETREIQTVEKDDSWDVCTYLFFGEESTLWEDTVGQGCEGFWEHPGQCAKDLEEVLVKGFGKEETEMMGKKTKCALPLPSLVPMSCRGGDTGSMLTLELITRFLGADSSWLGQGNFGCHKFAEPGDTHDKGNTTAYERARKRVFVIGHVWGHKAENVSEGDKVEASVRCLQANGGPKEQRIPLGASGNGTGAAAGGGSGSENAVTSLGLDIVLPLVVFSLTVFLSL